MKVTKIITLILLCIVFVSVFACENQNGDSTASPSPIPDPTPPELGGGADLPETYQYTRTWASGNETIVMHVWVKGEKSRADWSLYESPPGKNEKIKYIDDGEYKWIYDVDEHWAAKYTAEATVHQVEEHMLWFTKNYYGAMSEGIILLDMQAACDHDKFCSRVSITGHEIINGQSSTWFTYNALDGSTIHYWISPVGYLVKVEATDTTDYHVTMDYTDVVLNLSIPDDIFDTEKVAPGAVIVDFTAS